MVQFSENNYIIVKNAVKPDIAEFVYTYFKNKRAVADHMFKNGNDVTNKETYVHYGYFGEKGIIGEVDENFSSYGDLVMETLLASVQQLMEKNTGLSLIPTYSYARIYRKGSVLKRHKDRPECEISCTLNLGGDMWPIFVEPSGKEGKSGVKAELNPGDLLIYRGEFVEHWREPFDKTECCQVFLHYNDVNGEYGRTNANDHRPMLGLPTSYRKNERT
tara:strand:+ start:1096 stop:1749 length:654 start_codon:yes stop_codon:yes gene_type:complete